MRCNGRPSIFSNTMGWGCLTKKSDRLYFPCRPLKFGLAFLISEMSLCLFGFQKKIKRQRKIAWHCASGCVPIKLTLRSCCKLMRLLKNIVLFCTALFSSPAWVISYAQPQNFYFRNYGVKDGISYGVVNDICRDSEGFLWIGTFNGLNRFDGTEFKTFFSNPYDSTGIIGNDVLRICEDHDGNIWCATSRGVSRYNKSANSFSNYQLTNPHGFALLTNFVNEILCDRHGTIWCGTGAGIFEFDKTHDRFIGYYHDEKNPASPTNDHVYKNSFVEDPYADGIWMSGKGGVNFLDTKTKQFYNYKNNPQHLPVFDSIFVYPLCFDSKGQLWYIDRARTNMLCYDLLKHSITVSDLATDDQTKPLLSDVETIFVDSKQQQWLSTWLHPVFFKAPNDKIYRRFYHDEKINYSIGSDFFWDILEENDGTLWFGGISGISKLEPSRQYYYLLTPKTSLPSSSQFHYITAVHQQNSSILWLGTDSGLYSFDTRSFDCRKFKMNNSPPLNPFILSIAEIDSVLWLATFSGTKFFDLKTHRFIRKSDVPAALTRETESIMVVYKTSSGDIWVYDFSEKTLYRFNKQLQEWSKFQHSDEDPHSVSAEVAANVLEDEQGNIWFGTLQDGLMRFDKINQRFDFFKTGKNDNAGSSAGQMNAKFIQVQGICTADKDILFLLSDGLYRFNYRDSTFKTWHKADGLAADAMETILKDSYGNLWIVGRQDASVLNPKNNEFTSFRFNYDVSNYSYSNTSIRLLNGSICIPVGSALAICNPEVIQHTRNDFSRVLISDFSVFEKSIPFTQKQESVKLKYNQNFFSISFSSFSSGDDVQYAYKLDGFDPGWVYTNRRFASYTNVPGGDYTFLVKTGADGKWTAPTQIRITVVPPFWKTAWFKAIAIIVFLGLVYLVFRIRVQTIKRQQEQKLQLHTVRDKIARDLHDDVGASLSSIRMYSEAIRMQVKEKVPEADTVLGKMSENAREIVENMADIVWAINPRNDSLQFMEDRMHAFIAAVCGSKNIIPHFNQINFHELKLPMEMRKNIFLIFKEAVNNSAKYSACKNLYLNLEKSEDIFKLVITDDGKGFDETNIVFGNGLQSMKKRAAEIGGDLFVRSKPGEGTSIKLTLPLP